MKIKLDENLFLISLFIIIIFLMGSFLFHDYFSDYLIYIRGGIIAVLLATALILIIFSIPSISNQKALPPFYIVAIFWIYFYQVTLLYDAPLYASLTRCFFPLLLLLGMLTFLLNKKIEIIYLFFLGCWIFFNLFSLLGHQTPEYVSLLFLIGIILPGTVFLVLHVFFKMEGQFEHLVKGVSLGLLSVLTGMISIMLLATALKTGDIAFARNASDLNFGAGLLFLGWPFFIWRFGSYQFLFRFFIIILIVSVAVLSFSRTTIVLTAVLFIFTFFKPSRGITKKILLSLCLAVIIMLIFMPKSIPDYWLKRLNITHWSDLTNLQSETLKSVTSGDRFEIWNFALKSFIRNPLFGNGLGSFSALAAQETGGTFAYSAAHGLLFTMAAERGLFGFLLGTLIVVYICFNLFKRWLIEHGAWKEFFRVASISFLCFLLFAHTTGAEFMRAGTVYVDSIISVFLMIYLIIIMSWRQIKKQSPSL